MIPAPYRRWLQKVERAIGRWRTLLLVLRRARRRDDGIRRILVDTLYAQPSNLAMSAFGGTIASAIGAWLSHMPIFALIAAAVGISAFARLGVALCVPKLSGRSLGAAHVLFELGALTYAGLVGFQAALAIHFALPAEAQVVLLGFSIAYGAGISARNAGHPALAISQLFLTLFIPIVAMLIGQTLPGLMLALSFVVLFPSMATVTLHTHRVLRKSVTAAEISARLAEKMKAVARSDVLTGLNNRAGLDVDIARRLGTLAPEAKLALFWLDLDRFKEVNDLLGHQTGDRLLAEVAARLRRAAPPGATLARFGGDEFILACAVADRAEAECLALQVMDEVTGPMRLDRQTLEISASIGVALMPEDGGDLDTLMKSADLALYHAKDSGKGKATFFAPVMTERLSRRREIEAELRLALQGEELSVAFQPIVDLKSGRIRSFEALARWFHAEKGELSPEEFVTIAEESGAIITLGNWLLAHAARVAAQWPEDVTLAVNLSPLQIKAPGAAHAILAALREARLDPRRLELEITESALLEPSPQTDQFIEELHGAGVRFALDDFGTGYSSLASLNAYPFSRIKIDRSFVSGGNIGRKSEVIIRAVSGMADTLGLEIVAEGIESPEQAEWVAAAGCTLRQGWHFSRAVPDYLAGMLLERERAGAVPALNRSAA